MPKLKLHRWLHEHSLRLLAIRDTPGAIAGGVAIGFFFGFTPLFGLKTLCAIFFAWLTRTNILAAVIAGTMHDVLLPFMPFVYRGEYRVGYWLLNHEWPQRLSRLHVNWHEWRDWTAFLTVGKPLLLGSLVCGAPAAAVSYVATRIIVQRHQRRKHASAPPPAGAGS